MYRVIILLLMIVGSLLPAHANAGVIVAIDAPTQNGQSASVALPFAVSGWAIDTAATTNTGIQAVDVWAFPTSGAAAIYVGGATFGARPDVASAYGPQFQNAGYGVIAQGLPPGSYTIKVYAYSSISQSWSNPDVPPGAWESVTIPAGSHMAVDGASGQTINQPYQMSGWAIDTGATTGTGASEVHVWAYTVSGDTRPSPFFVASAAQTGFYGGSRPAVGALYGSRFTPSGWQASISGLTPGAVYDLVAFMWSDVAHNFTNSVSQRVTVPPTVPTPTILTSGGTFTAPVSVTISVPDGADVYYTTNGSAPTTGSTHYTGPIPLDGLTYLRACAFRSGWTASAMAAADYVFQVPAPAITAGMAMPSGGGGLYISAEITSIPGATVRFTRDGSTPSETSELYSTPLSLTVNTSLRARAFKPNWIASVTAAQEFSVPLSTPEIAEAAGTYQTALAVHIAGPSGADVHFTRDGSTPSQTSEAYTAPFQISGTTLLRVQAFKSGNAPSAVTTADYFFAVPAPTIVTAGGAYAGPTTIDITVPTGATVRFTRDGSTPSETSELYAGGIAITSNTSLKARAFRSGWTTSATVSADYTVALATPTIVTAGGVYSVPMTTEITAPVGAEVRFTRNGSTPAESSELYVGSVQIAGNTQLRAQAFKAGNAPSAVASADYTLQVVTPTIVTAGGAYGGPLTVVIDVPAGTEVRITRDGSTPSETSELYAAGGLQVDANTSLRARAFKTGWTASNTVSADYTVATAMDEENDALIVSIDHRSNFRARNVRSRKDVVDVILMANTVARAPK